MSTPTPPISSNASNFLYRAASNALIGGVVLGSVVVVWNVFNAFKLKTVPQVVPQVVPQIVPQVVPQSPQNPASKAGPLPKNLQDIVDTQKEHLDKLKTLAAKGGWEHLREHTSHVDSGFDWWMFPIKRNSAGYGKRFTVDDPGILLLKQNPSFMKSYREGVLLVARSWGWDLATGKSVKTDKQQWVGYNVRLGKMLDSLTLFGETELKDSLIQFLRQEKIIPTLDKWIKDLIPLEK